MKVKDLMRELKASGDAQKGLFLQRFFKTGPGQYAAGDVFLGLTVPQQRQIAKKYRDLPLASLQELLDSPIHEFRLSALFIMVWRYEQAADLREKKKIADFYYKNRRQVNNWDLVDLSAPNIFGDYLLVTNQGMGRLIKMTASKDLWERRIAMLSTFAFIKAGRTEETFTIAKHLMGDRHDLIHKAVGWMLREAGKRVSEGELGCFLDEHALQMPRTMLRYAIERFTPERRRYYLKLGKVL